MVEGNIVVEKSMTFNEMIFSSQLGKILTGIVIFFLGLVFAYFTEKIISKLLKEIKIDEAVKKIGFDIYLSEVIADLAKKVIWFVSLVLALNQMGILKIVTYIFAALIALILILGILIYIFDFFVNLSKRKYIKAPNKGLTETKIVRHGELMFVPHKYIYERLKTK